MPNELASVRLARAFVAEALGQWTTDVDGGAAALATSEVVTNAVLYTASEVTLTIRLDDDMVRVEVEDASRRRPIVRHATPETTSGRGMDIVDAVCEHWGVRDAPEGGKVVWFTLPVTPSVGSAAGSEQVGSDSRGRVEPGTV